MNVQWAGDLKALIEFDSSNRDKLPHIVKSSMCLGWANPCRIRLIRRAAHDSANSSSCNGSEDEITDSNGGDAGGSDQKEG